MYEGVDTLILYEELAYQDTVPLAWRPMSAPLSGDAQHQNFDRNLRLLQACVALDEQGQTDKADEDSPHSADILRLDMKMNLLLDLVGRILIANQPRPEAAQVRFNAHGAIWKHVGASIKPGDEGVLEIYLKDCLVEPLRMAGRIVNVLQGSQAKIKFQHPGDAVADLIEKLVFRRHRRQVADQRQSRNSDAPRVDKLRR